MYLSFILSKCKLYSPFAFFLSRASLTAFASGLVLTHQPLTRKAGRMDRIYGKNEKENLRGGKKQGKGKERKGGKGKAGGKKNFVVVFWQLVQQKGGFWTFSHCFSAFQNKEKHFFKRKNGKSKKGIYSRGIRVDTHFYNATFPRMELLLHLYAAPINSKKFKNKKKLRIRVDTPFPKMKNGSSQTYLYRTQKNKPKWKKLRHKSCNIYTTRKLFFAFQNHL